MDQTSEGSEFFPFRADPYSKGRRYFASPETVAIFLNDFIVQKSCFFKIKKVDFFFFLVFFFFFIFFFFFFFAKIFLWHLLELSHPGASN